MKLLITLLTLALLLSCNSNKGCDEGEERVDYGNGKFDCKPKQNDEWPVFDEE